MVYMHDVEIIEKSVHTVFQEYFVAEKKKNSSLIFS